MVNPEAGILKMSPLWMFADAFNVAYRSKFPPEAESYNAIWVTVPQFDPASANVNADALVAVPVDPTVKLP